MKYVKQSWLMATLMLFVAFSLAKAQTAGASGVPAGDLMQYPTKLIKATQQYKSSTSELLSIQESEVSKATAQQDELRALVAEGLVARAELESSEQSLAVMCAQLETTKKQIADSDQNIAKIQAAFLAFRAAIPGVATGPHIHIGSPSHWL